MWSVLYFLPWPFTTQCSPLHIGLKLASAVSSLLHTQLNSTLGADCDQTQYTLACLPLRHGGFGLQNPVFELAPAILASTLSCLQALDHDTHIPDALMANIPAARSLYASEYGLRIPELDFLIQAPTPQEAVDLITRDMCSQKWWSEHLLDTRLTQWVASAPARLRCLQLGTKEGRMDPLGSFRNEDTGHPIPNHQWLHYIRFRLGVPLSPVPQRCPGCSQSMDCYSDNALSCKTLGSTHRRNPPTRTHINHTRRAA